MQAALGSRVEVTGVIDPVVSGAIQVIGTAPDGDDDDDDDAAAPETERRIGPLMGTDDTVLVLSPPFPSGGNESLMWITRDTVVGRLSPLADIRENVPGVIHGAESLRSTMRHWGANVPEDAWLIIADEEDGATVDRHLVPLAGSENRIFVALTDAEERQALTRGGVRGMLRVQPASACEGLADAMGVTLPEQIGLLSTQVPSTEGLDAGVVKAMGLGLGALFLGVAGVMFWWGRSVRARQAVPGREPLSEPVEEPWQNAA